MDRHHNAAFGSIVARIMMDGAMRYNNGPNGPNGSLPPIYGGRIIMDGNRGAGTRRSATPPRLPSLLESRVEGEGPGAEGGCRLHLSSGGPALGDPPLSVRGGEGGGDRGGGNSRRRRPPPSLFPAPL